MLSVMSGVEQGQKEQLAGLHEGVVAVVGVSTLKRHGHAMRRNEVFRILTVDVSDIVGSW